MLAHLIRKLRIILLIFIHYFIVISYFILITYSYKVSSFSLSLSHKVLSLLHRTARLAFPTASYFQTSSFRLETDIGSVVIRNTSPVYFFMSLCSCDF